jgi:hypothetical protein
MPMKLLRARARRARREQSELFLLSEESVEYVMISEPASKQASKRACIMRKNQLKLSRCDKRVYGYHSC